MQLWEITLIRRHWQILEWIQRTRRVHLRRGNKCNAPRKARTCCTLLNTKEAGERRQRQLSEEVGDELRRKLSVKFCKTEFCIE